MTDAHALLARVVRALARPRRATYRLQLGPDLRFEEVAALAPYLADLGVSEAYLSPCFKSGPESSHGYDVTDHNAFNPEVGTEAAFDRTAAALAERGLGVLLDIVPNHMGIAGDSNPWWLDVLENGPSSSYASFFDIDWAPVKAELTGKVLLPILPDQYGRVLEAQGLRLEFAEGAFFVRYGEARLPIAPKTYALVLRHGLEALGERLGPEDPHFMELQSILTALDHLPPRTETDPGRRAERFREKEIVKRRLAALVKESEEVRAFVEENVRAFNGTPGEPRSFDRLDGLLSAQAYRLADWRVAGDEINYRRFFDVNHLAAIRMELPEVFEVTHRLVLRLVGEGKVTGLRVDHPDGLYAPGEYFRRLQEGAVRETARRLEPGLDEAGLEALLARYREAAAADPAAPSARPLWILAEKILLGDERLPEWWPVAGTTGYDFLASANGLFVDRDAARPMTSTYARFVGARTAMADLVYATKRLIMLTSMASEINMLGLDLDRISETNRLSRDFTLSSLVRVLREVIACFPVYRTYVGDERLEVSPRDRAYIEMAVAEARRRIPTVNVSIFDFVRDTLLLRHLPELGAEEGGARRHFVMRFQQTTGPVTAKGVEDTALYRYNRLVSLNEVGGDPARFGEPVSAFHERSAERLARWPETLLATSTHDTKRGEDVRARIHVLSEIPRDWRAQVGRWGRLNRRKKVVVGGQLAPDRNEEYLLYQTLVGTWPLGSPGPAELADYRARIRAYMEKATKEAKVHTSWINPSEEYDRAVQAFVVAVLEDTPGNRFLAELRAFQARIVRYGLLYALGQTVLKIASPGIPDLYQGTELWDFSLVDPDNRRPVDYATRRALLEKLRERIAASGGDLVRLARELAETLEDGRVKLYVVHRGLAARRELPRLFATGAYLPMEAQGERAEHVIAFARQSGDRVAVAVVPRLATRLGKGPEALPLGEEAWGESWLPLPTGITARRFDHCFTGERLEPLERDGRPGLPLAGVFANFPVALLLSTG